MESYESKHSDQSFTSKLAQELGVTAPPLRLDSQAKYGIVSLQRAAAMLCMLCWASCAEHAVLSALPWRLDSQRQCNTILCCA